MIILSTYPRNIR